MADMVSWPYNSTVSGDPPVYSNPIDAEALAAIMAKIITNGVFWGNGTELQVTASGTPMEVSISPGFCAALGHIGHLPAAASHTLDTGDSLPRIDRIVARHDLQVEYNKFRTVVIKGTPASTPSAPALTRTSTTYDLALADVAVAAGAATITQANITDVRPAESVCGIVAGLLSDLSTEALYDQFQAEFDAWFATVVSTLGETEAGNLLNMINALDTRVAALEAKAKTIKTGTVSVTATSGNTGSRAVTFAVPFSAAPKVVPTLQTAFPGGGRIASVSNVTASGFTAYLYNSGADVTLPIQWIAIGD